MSKVKSMTYTKDNGEVSQREVIVVSPPRDLYLVYDVSKLTESQIQHLQSVLEEIDIYRNDCIADWEQETGLKQSSLWRSFKPGGINWGIK
jgi:hypothetical protein